MHSQEGGYLTMISRRLVLFSTGNVQERGKKGPSAEIEVPPNCALHSVRLSCVVNEIILRVMMMIHMVLL